MVAPVHQISSDTDTDVEDDKLPKASGKRPIDLADDVHKPIDEEGTP